MKKVNFLGISISIEALAIGAIIAACGFPGFFYYLFYNVGYGLLLSIIVPLWYAIKHEETVTSLGIVPVRMRQIIVMLGFIVLSIGGQFIPLVLNQTVIQWNYFLVGFVPLIMTTLFEEFLFRGFMQTRFEKMFGCIPAIILSGLLFSLYHLGYPGFRGISDLTLLFAVGCGFSLAYMLSGNCLAVSYFVNLPNAFLTYVLKQAQFPVMDGYSVLFAALTILVAIPVLVVGFKQIKKNA